jgi:serine/threonine protein kinase
MLPKEFGAYTLHELIARGGMAEIYRGVQRSEVAGFEKIVAIKKILPNLAENEEFITMLIDEARISVQLNHANIAQVYDLGRVDDAFYIAMEFIPGFDLAHIIKKLGKDGYLIPLDHAIFITKELCAGLYYAHSKKDEKGEPLRIVHRDISPHNVLVSFGGDVKIIDFGIAKASVKLGQTRMGVIKGKLLYMAPEQAMARPIDARADVFSAGLSLYRMLTGVLPFEGDNEFQIYNNVLTKQIEPPRERNPEIPEDLNAVVMKALERDVAQRYQDAWSVHEDLVRVLHRINPGYTQNHLGRFMAEYFEPKRRPAQPAVVEDATEQSSPSALSGQHPAPGVLDTPADFAKTPVRQPPAARVSAAAPTVPIPVGQALADLLNAVDEAPPPDLPSPESLGYKPAAPLDLAAQDELEADPTVDMRLDPALLHSMSQMAQRRQMARQGSRSKAPAPATTPMAMPGTATTAPYEGEATPGGGGLKISILFVLVIVGAVALAITVGVVSWQMGVFDEDPQPTITAPAPAAPAAAPAPAPSAAPAPAPSADPAVPSAARKSAPSSHGDAGVAITEARPRLLAAVASAAKNHRSEVVLTLTTRPPGAKVLRGRKVIGTTPVKIAFPRDPKGRSTVKFSFQLNGYKRAEVELIPNKDRAAAVTLMRRDRNPQNNPNTGGGDGLMDPW